MDSDNEDSVLQLTPPSVVEAASENTLQLLPTKSRLRYEDAYNKFMEWRRKSNVKSSFSENVLLAYFGELAKKICPNTLWTQYSMLRSTLMVYQNVNITLYLKLKGFLKKKSHTYKPKKSKTLTAEEVNRFIKEAPDDKYLLEKVILVFGISGAMRRQELVQLTVDDVKDVGSALVVKLSLTKNNKERVFTIVKEFYEIYRKYAALRPFTTERRLFLNYQNRKCTKQPVGINKIGGIPKIIASYLGLEDPTSFTGHCLRRSSSTIFMDAGGSMEDLKRHGGWASTSVAEGYIQESIGHKMKVASKIITAVTNSTENRPQEPDKSQMLSSTSIFTSSSAMAELPDDSENSNKRLLNFNNCSFSNVTFNLLNK